MPPPTAPPATARPADELASPPRRPGRRGSALALGLVVVAGLLGGVLLLSIAVGSRDIPLGTVWEAFRHFEANDTDHVIVRSVRMPRTVVGLMVGAALGLAGALMQGVTRNPLADPGILGVNGGAALFVVAATVYLLGSLGREGATPVIAMKDGAIVAEGNPAAMVTEAVVGDVFNLAVRIVPDPVAGTPMVVPIGRHTTGSRQPDGIRPATAKGTAARGPVASALAASALANGVCRPPAT